MRSILLLLILSFITSTMYAQNNVNDNDKTVQQNTVSEYAYIKVLGKSFTKKLKVEVDFGDSEPMQRKGEEYSEILTNKKSYAAILNYMAEKKYELLQTIELTSSYQGSGGTLGVIFIMKKN